MICRSLPVGRAGAVTSTSPSPAPGPGDHFLCIPPLAGIVPQRPSPPFPGVWSADEWVRAAGSGSRLGSFNSAIVTGRLVEAPGSSGGLAGIVVFRVGRWDGPGQRTGAEPGSERCSKGSRESRFRTACRGICPPGWGPAVVQSARHHAERTKPRHAGNACRGLLLGQSSVWVSRMARLREPFRLPGGRLTRIR